MTSPGGPTGARRVAVCALSVLLLAAGLGLIWHAAPEWDGRYLPFSLPWWALVPGYFLAFKLRAEYEFRREMHSFHLSHVPLVLGAVFVAPWWHLLARTAATVAHGVVPQRHRPVKLLFNVALGCFEAGVAIALLNAMQPAPRAGAALWAVVLAALMASELLSFLAMQVLLELVGAQQTWSARWSGLGTSIATAAVFGGVAIIFVAALWTDPLVAIVIVAVAIALVLGWRAHRTLAAQQQQGAELNQFVKGLGPLDLDDVGSRLVLDHVRELLHAHQLELALQQNGAWRSFRVTDLVATPVAPLEGEVALLDGEPPVVATSVQTEDSMATPLLGSNGMLGVLTVRERMGDVHSFGIRDLRLLETIGSALASALERGILQRDLSLAATTDPLTGLPNLNELTGRLDQLLRAEPEGVLVAAVAVDSFREVNDTLGHEVGDELLLEVTRRLRITHPEALLGRIGGGRFAVCAPASVAGGDASLFGLGLRAQVEGGAQLGPVGTHIKLSVGCVQAPEHGNDAATLIRRAETAMYSARHALGGPVVWEPVYEVEGQRRLAVVMALREAISSGAIGVAYQPKMRASDRSVTGVEALARWTHPALGAISPVEFVPLAEAAGLMAPLTTLVLRQALTACKGWQRRGGRVGVAVNVSAETVLDPSFVTEVAALLTSTNVSPDLLTLELTEGVVLNDPDLAIVRMAELRALGLKLSVDDFGTGYSSLTYLKGLPVDEVKIDKGFVDRVLTDAGDRAVVRAVVDIAHTLGLTVVAEGVEQEDQHATLSSLGVDELQGYLHGRPMPALDMAQWLRRRDSAASES